MQMKPICFILRGAKMVPMQNFTAILSLFVSAGLARPASLSPSSRTSRTYYELILECEITVFC